MLAAQAKAHGMEVSAYVATLIEQAARPGTHPSAQSTLSEFLLQSPLAGSGINLERDQDTGRNIEL